MRSIAVAPVLSLLLTGQAIAKPREERWIATSTTAISITGDILLSPTRLRTAGVDIPLRVAADIPDYHYGGDARSSVAARVLAVTRLREFKLLNGNRFSCGKPIRWIVVWRFGDGTQLGMDTFSGAKLPRSATGPDFCASYFYMRPGTH